MKKWLIGVFILVSACAATTLVQNNKTAQADSGPKPYITFDGKNVQFAPGMPDCH